MARPLGQSFDCAGCGAKLMMARGPKGKNIPLETRNMHTVYRLIVDATDPDKTRCEEESRGYLNHFVTCPKRDEFKGGTRDA